MSDNKLNIQITAEDLATAVIAGINTSFSLVPTLQRGNASRTLQRPVK